MEEFIVFNLIIPVAKIWWIGKKLSVKHQGHVRFVTVPSRISNPFLFTNINLRDSEKT